MKRVSFLAIVAMMTAGGALAEETDVTESSPELAIPEVLSEDVEVANDLLPAEQVESELQAILDEVAEEVATEEKADAESSDAEKAESDEKRAGHHHGHHGHHGHHHPAHHPHHPVVVHHPHHGHHHHHPVVVHPTHPHYPTHPGSVTCWAKNARGELFSASGSRPSKVQRMAMRRCEKWSRWCEPMGCR